MRTVKVVVVAAIVFFIIGGLGYAVGKHDWLTKADQTPPCIAGPNEICPDPSFLQALKDLKALGDREKALYQDPKVKELIEVVDTERGMQARLGDQIQATLKANPGHQWDGVKQKFTPEPATQQIPAPSQNPQTVIVPQPIK